MRIGFFRHSILNRGGDKAALAYAQALSRRGHTVTLWVRRIETVFPLPEGVRIERLAAASKAGTVWAALTRRLPVDVVVVDIVALALLLSLRNSGRVVYLAEDYDESYYRSFLMRALIRILYHCALQGRRIPAVAVSAELAQIFRRRFRREAPVIPNGIDLDEFPVLAPRRERAGCLRVLVFSRGDYRKGFDIARAVLASSVREGKEPFEVWAVGEEARIDGLTVVNYGFVAPRRVHELLREADILLYPTRHEGLPFFVLEALACGCCVVTTTAAGVVTDGVDALVSAPGDARLLQRHLCALLSDPSLRARLRAQGYRTVQRYSFGQSAQRLEAFLGEVCGSGGSRP